VIRLAVSGRAIRNQWREIITSKPREAFGLVSISIVCFRRVYVN
jgi:hypothetical protein